MKKLLPGIFTLCAVLPAAAALGGSVEEAAASESASEEAIVELQADLRNLEAELEGAELRGADISSDIRRRVESIRENAIYLKVKMQRHQESGRSGTGVEVEEVDELGDEIRQLREDLDRVDAPRSGTAAGTSSVPTGTVLDARLLDTLSSETAEAGDPFRAAVVDPVSDGGAVVVPAGATIEGRVELVDRPSSRTDRSSRLVLAFESIVIDGDRYPLDATLVDASEDLETGIGDEAAKIGIGAGIGAILGAVLGGDEGAVIGGVIGSAGAILGTEGKDVMLPRGTVLELRLDDNLSVRSETEE